MYWARLWSQRGYAVKKDGRMEVGVQNLANARCGSCENNYQPSAPISEPVFNIEGTGLYVFL